MDTVFGSAATLGWVALKTLLLYATAVIGFRLSKRRTLAEMSAFDFVAAVAVGAIVGRIPSAHDAGYLAGAVTLVVVLAAHRVVAGMRRWPPLGRLVDHRPVLLVADGDVLEQPLREAGLTRADLFGLLRQQGVLDLAEVRYVVFEQRGQISVVRTGAGSDGGLLDDVVS
jgi:uncharacterized membrane protein YcaP (DUF421 family)